MTAMNSRSLKSANPAAADIVEWRMAFNGSGSGDGVDGLLGGRRWVGARGDEVMEQKWV